MEREAPKDYSILLTNRSLERRRSEIMQNLPTERRLKLDRFFDSLPIWVSLRLRHYHWEIEADGVAGLMSAALGFNDMEEEIVRNAFKARLQQVARTDVTIRMDNLRSAILKWTAERAGENLDDQIAVENWVYHVLNAGQIMGTLFTREEFNPESARQTLLSLGQNVVNNRPPEQYLNHDMFIYVYKGEIQRQDRRTGRISSF